LRNVRYASFASHLCTTVARVRARIGRACSHPRSIEVQIESGQVTIAGQILEREVDRVLSAVKSVRGVLEVHNRLEPHPVTEGVPELQGGVPRRSRFELMQERWSPTARVATGMAGGSLAVYGLTRGRWSGAPVGVAGAALLLRAATNLPTKRLFGFGAGRRAVDLQNWMKTWCA